MLLMHAPHLDSMSIICLASLAPNMPSLQQKRGRAGSRPGGGRSKRHLQAQQWKGLEGLDPDQKGLLWRREGGREGGVSAAMMDSEPLASPQRAPIPPSLAVQARRLPPHRVMYARLRGSEAPVAEE